MAKTQVTEKDEGKRVVDTDGTEVGVVSAFRGGKAYVDPDPDITDEIMAKLGWESIDEDDYTLDPDRVETITEDEVRLGR